MAAEEPKLTRYRLVEGYSEKLEYPTGTVHLSFCGNREDCWMLYATKEGDPASFLEIMRRPTMFEWAQARFQGFDVAAGSPADKILAKMVREGNAVKMAPGENFYIRSVRQQRYH
jgi:hypothetical protein